MILNLEKAIQLYEIIGRFIPEVENRNYDILDFAGKIVNNIIDSQQHRVYLEAISLMTGYSVEELIANNEPKDLLLLFINGIAENNLIKLKFIMESLGYGLQS